MNNLQQKFYKIIFFIGVFFFIAFNFSYSQQFSSPDFLILDPVMTSGDGFSSSTDYSLSSSIGPIPIAIGTSSSADFGLGADFWYFPNLTLPIVSATPGNGIVVLNWTPATSTLGWTVTGYDVGISSVSGGPYSYSSFLGNVLTSIRTGLSSGIPYYFVVRIFDGLGNVIGTSTQVTATPIVPPVVPSAQAGGFMGGGTVTSVAFSGVGYPKGVITLLKDGQIVSTSVAGQDGVFMIGYTNITTGVYNFSLYLEDINGLKSSTQIFLTSVTSGFKTNISGIFVSPTIMLDKSKVKQGNDLIISGQSIPVSEILISVDGKNFIKTISDINGLYSYKYDTSLLDYGMHIVKSKSSVNGQYASEYSNNETFIVGETDMLNEKIKKCFIKGDLNDDCRVNLIDFSIASYWYKKQFSEAFKKVEITKLNGDGKINLIDFSIMAFNWTG